MKKNWDYIEFSDYKSDMEDLGQQASAVIDKLVKERKHFERMFWAAVIASGGHVRINNYIMNRLYNLEGLHWEGRSNPLDDAIEFRASFLNELPRQIEEGALATDTATAPGEIVA